MDLPTSSNTIDLQISPVLTGIYQAMIHALSLLFLLCYEHPKTSLAIGMILAYMVISTILDYIIYTFFTTPVHCLPLAIALIMVAIAWYLHHLINEHDVTVLKEAVTAAELAAVEQAKYLNEGEEGGSEGDDNSEGKENVFGGKTRERAKTGGLDTDVWQGGQRLKRRGWTPDRWST
ncbi:hypothetical protein BKA64DRAFT_666164 [Cadophora sp. MPI-SDFR-AT-0126]|nr:hypothetical protein BKA64DRAFT_666164 [Leotiomycetes sp. MPI-SDFR-AT-0126]